MRNFVVSVLEQQSDANAAATTIKQLIQTLREGGHVQNSRSRGKKLKAVHVVVLFCAGLLLNKSLEAVADIMVEHILVVQTDRCSVAWRPKISDAD